MMKKLLPYILIIILIGIFLPFLKTEAAFETFGVCWGYNNTIKDWQNTYLREKECLHPLRWSSDGKKPTYLNCTNAATDIKDGWGWENGQSCKASTTTPNTPTTPSPTKTPATSSGNGTCTHITPFGTIETRITISSLCLEPDKWQLNSTSMPTPTPANVNTNVTAEGTVPTKEPYILLAPLPCKEGPENPACICTGTPKVCTMESFDPASTKNGKNVALSSYLNMMITLFIGICAVLAVIMIVMGGVEYMTSELISSKEAGKERITNAIFGLLLALGSWTILNQINPNLLRSDLNIDDVTVNVDMGGESSEPFTPTNVEILKAHGITCNGQGGKPAIESIGKQFMGKTTYSMENRNKSTSSTLYVDCSSFVNQVYKCAGLPSPGNNTGEIFSSGATAVDGKTFDPSKLNVGDLLGWQKGGGEKNGHVVIYLGDGKILDASSTAGAVAVRNLSTIKNRVKFVKWPK